MSLYLGLEIGKRGIMSTQTVLNTIGHNIANANTTGYSRQVADLTATRPYSTPALNSAAGAGQIGTGVEVSSIMRIRDAFVDTQYRYENSSLGYWTATQTAMDKIEVIINEPSDEGLRSVLDAFWASWQDLAADPENESVRAVVSEQGQAVCDAFQHMYRQFYDQRNDLNANVAIDVDEINTIANEIQGLNRQIAIVTVSGKEPNDLKDKRDVLLDELSKLVNIKVSDAENGMINVQLGGSSLVQGAEVRTLTTQQDSYGMHTVIWADNLLAANITDGELKAYLDARDITVPDMIDNLNALAKTTILKTNEIHSQGYSLNNTTQEPDGTDFFTIPTNGVSPDDYEYWAREMAVSTDITEDPKNIAAALLPTYDSSGNISNFGDGNNALAIAQLKQNINSAGLVCSQEIALVNNAAYSLIVNYGGIDYNVTAAAPAYTSLAGRAAAIQASILATAGLAASGITVTADGNRLIISSSETDFEGIEDLTVDGTNYGDYTALAGMIYNATTDDFWRSIAAEVGVVSDEAIRNSNNQDTLVSELENQRQSVSGVSLDEEATDMVKYQHAYNASSRFITVIDEMLDKLINDTGVVGR